MFNLAVHFRKGLSTACWQDAKPRGLTRTVSRIKASVTCKRCLYEMTRRELAFGRITEAQAANVRKNGYVLVEHLGQRSVAQVST